MGYPIAVDTAVFCTGGRTQAQQRASRIGYLPMQKREKISPSKSSELNVPVISLR